MNGQFGQARQNEECIDCVTSTSHSLLERLRSQDLEAWDRLVSLYVPLVYYWCQKLNLPDQEAADVAQDVFKSVSTNIQKFRKDRPGDTFRGWLRTITRSKVMDHFRRQKRQPIGTGGSEAQRRMTEYADLFDDESTDQPAYYGLFLRACEMIRQDFKESTWQAFWKVVVDGLTPNEVAEELSMRPGTVRVAKSRVLQRLRCEMGELIE